MEHNDPQKQITEEENSQERAEMVYSHAENKSESFYLSIKTEDQMTEFLNEEEIDFLFVQKSRPTFSLQFLRRCVNLHNNPIFQQFVDVLKGWNQSLEKKDKPISISYEQNICNSIYRALRRAALMDLAQAIKELQKNYQILGPHIKSSPEQKFDIKMPFSTLTSTKMIQRQQMNKTQSRVLLQSQSNIQKSVNILQKIRSVSHNDLCNFQYLAYRRRSNEVKLAREFKEILNIKEQFIKRKQRLHQERDKLEKLRINRRNEKTTMLLSSAKNQIKQKAKSQQKLQSIDGMGLINQFNPHVIPPKQKKLKTTNFQWKWKLVEPTKKNRKLLLA